MTTPNQVPADKTDPIAHKGRESFAWLVGREIRHRIDHALSSVTAEPGTQEETVERAVKRHLSNVWTLLKRRPGLGIVLAGGLGVVAAEAVGVGELLVALGCSYAAYEILKKGASLSEAVQRSEGLFRP